MVLAFTLPGHEPSLHPHKEEKKMDCREYELPEWCKSLECRMGDLRIEATKVFMQANFYEDQLPAHIRWLRGVFNTLYSILRNIVKITENERKAKELVEGLPIVTVSDFHVDDGLFCGVCRDDFIWGEEVREIPCMIGHIFHSHCIWPWLEDHNTCPICTTPFSMENEPKTVREDRV
ncbi:uncharacterized protein LOC131039765 [Cryptomeria japonica]|uniref:uncharacterized protein LOC131039765 n=1 Tax=Cryptomeria japonica TaxID=3369 RepID=UPI0025AD7DA9|nr:uncharacterized protein LOC131039765 [Cryptomeria japonica]